MDLAESFDRRTAPHERLVKLDVHREQPGRLVVIPADEQALDGGSRFERPTATDSTRRTRVDSRRSSSLSASTAGLYIGAYRAFPKATTPSPDAGCQRMFEP